MITHPKGKLGVCAVGSSGRAQSPRGPAVSGGIRGTWVTVQALIARELRGDAVIASWRDEVRSRVLGRRRRETARDDCISERGSKVFELLEGGNRDSGRPEKESSVSLRRGYGSFTYRICISSEVLRRRVVQRGFFPRSLQSE